MRTPKEAQEMVWAIHAAVHTLAQTGDRYKDSCLQQLAEAAYAYDGGWLTRLDYGNEKPVWMSTEMWQSLDDPDPSFSLRRRRESTKGGAV